MKTIIQKAINLQHKKLLLYQDNFFRLEGNIKSIFYSKEADIAMLRLQIVDTHAYQSSQQAKGHFAEFGISSQNPAVMQSVHRNMKEKQEKSTVTTYPEQHVDQIIFPTVLVVAFTRPIEEWKKGDAKFES